MLERLLGLLFFATWRQFVKGLDVYNWPGEVLQRIDPYLDLKNSSSQSTSRLILPDGFESTELASTSESIYYPMGQKTTLMRSFMTNGTTLLGVAYLKNNTFSIDRRLFDDFRSDTNLLQTTYLGNIFGNTSFINEIDTNCFDARLMDSNKFVFICKQFFPTNGSAAIRLVVFQYFSSSNISLSFVSNSATYISNTRGILSNSWSGYVRATISCDIIEDLIVVTDVAMASYAAGVYSGPNTVIMFLAGFGQSSTLARGMGLSDRITIATTDVGTAAVFSVVPSYITNTYAVTISSGQTSCKNAFYMLAEAGNNKYNCFAETNVDDTIVGLIRNLVTPATFDLKCQLVETVVNTNYAMEKIFRSGGNIEIYLRARAIVPPVSGTRKITYEAAILKPAEVVTSTVSTHFRFVELNSTRLNPTPANPLFLTSARVFVVIPEKLVYVCWRAYSYMTVNSALLPNTTIQNCQMVDLFTVSADQFVSTDITSTQLAITFIGRLYGPFISLNFDADPNTFMPKRMIGFRQFIDAPQFFNSDKSFQIYDLSLTRNTFKMSSGAALANNTSIMVTDLDEFNPQVVVRTMLPTDTFMSMNPNISNIRVGFKNQTWVSFQGLADRLFAQNSFYTLTATNTSLHDPKIVISWKHQMTYMANANISENVVIVDKRLVQFTENNGTYSIAVFGFIYLTSNGSNSDGSYSLVQPPFALGGSWSSKKDNYRYANLLRVELISTGLYIYFQNTTGNNTFPVLRFDLVRYIFTSREFPFPVKCFETFSRIFMVYLNNTVLPQRVYWAMVPETTNKDLGYSDPRNTTWNFTLDEGYKVNGLSDISIGLETKSKSILLNIVTETNNSAAYLHRHVLMMYAWDDQTIYDKTGPVIRQRRTVDITGFLLNNVFGNNKCIFQDGILFLNQTTAGTTLTLTVLNTTTFALYTYTENVVAGGGSSFMQCADSHAMINYNVATNSFKSVLYRLNAGLESYKRIRSVTTSTAIPLSIYAFSQNSFTQILANNSFIRFMKYTTKIYVSTNTKTVFLPTPDQVNTSIVNTNLKLNGYAANLIINTVELTKSSMLKADPIYVGNETIELQKKIRYESSTRTTYAVEDYYKLPMSFFDIKLNGNIPASRISVMERVRRFGEINLWQEALEFNQKRCKFALRGSNMASIMDDVMLRVDVDDNSFCMQLSRISPANGVMSMVKYNDFQQSNGYVKMCRIVRDMSLFTPNDVAAKRAAGQIINYAISCIYVESGQEYLWLLLVPLGESFDNIFKPIDNLVKWTLPFIYTSYDISICENSVFVSFHNKDSLRIWYIKSIFTYGPGTTTIVPTFLFLDGVYAYNLLYSVPTEAGKKITGLILMVASETSPGMGTFILDRYRIMSSGDVGMSLSERIPLNQTIDTLSCAYQNAGGVAPFMSCAYLSAFSRSTLYYTVDMLNSSSLENYVAPLLDLEIRQLKTIYLKRFWYLTISYSPLTGKLFLVVFKHVSSVVERDPPPLTGYDTSLLKIIIHDSLEITQSNLDPENCEISMFNTAKDDYLSIKDGNKMVTYKFNHFEISIDGGIAFQDIANTKLVIVDHMENPQIEMFLSLFFREKVSVSLVWIYILGVALVVTGGLVLVYLFFKKANKGLQQEVDSKITENTATKKNSKSKANKSSLLDKSETQLNDSSRKSAEVELL